MKIKNETGFLPIKHTHSVFSGRKNKYALVALCIFIILFSSATLLTAQSIENNYLLDPYEDVYIWKEKEIFSTTEDSVLTVLGRWAWGPCLAVDADSSYAYIGNGATFQILDISNPSSPTIVGEYLTEGYIYDIEIRNNVAFLCIGRWFLILDISDPLHPSKMSDIIIATSDAAISFALDDDFAYVTTYGGVMWAVDVSDLNIPFKRDAIAAGGELAFCIEAKDSYVYIGNPEWPPMVIVDATNPDSLTRVDFEMGGWGYSAFINDTLLFLGVHGYSGRQFKIYNVTNAASPEFVGQMQLTNLEDIMAITVSEDGLTSYFRTTSGCVYSVDISNIEQPVLLDQIENIVTFNFGNSGISFLQNTIFSAHYSGLAIIDVSRSDSLNLYTFSPTGGEALELDSEENIVFAACGYSGMWILDCSNPLKIESIGNIITGGYTANVVVEDSLAYIYNWSDFIENDTTIGLWIIDISNPFSPTAISHYKPNSTATFPHSLAKSNNYIFTTQKPNSVIDTVLEIIDVTNAINPKYYSSIEGDFETNTLTVKDSILYVATFNRGLKLYNISDVYNPYEINSLWDSTDIVVSQAYDNLLYVDKVDTFFVLDISNVYSPTILGGLVKASQGSPSSLDAAKNYVYTAKGGIIDVYDPKFPNELTQFTDLVFGYDVESIENLIIFSDRIAGIWLLRNNLITSVEEPHLISPNDFKLLQNYPNPFNPFTTIEFVITKKEKVLIEIFNVLGQKIQILMDQEIEAGNHKIVFNSFGLSSGIYFYRMKTRETAITKKMVIIR